MQRYFLTETPETDEFDLPADIAHHLMTVLRGKVGTMAEFVYPDRETMVVAKVSEIGDDVTRMTVVERVEANVELPVQATLILGLAKGDKPELVVQKATELGVHHIIFVETDWSVVHWGMKADKKIARLAKIAQGAAEQSHRLTVPDVQYLPNLQALTLPEAMIKIVAWEESAKQGEAAMLAQQFAQLRSGDEVAFLVGPEGGLKEAELELLTEKFGFVAAGLGPRILRAETAPLYALSALSFALELER
ncbi:16S rRNA (uracil(1498)-N(3))-methyltransferase [Weissella cibaria]|jgi:RNA methyltransferase, RsmE family|uniref:Ribosomal RNA small subunit methyltransferase E n=1 Tax=Weissella cibaria TaxID=137591 RepID=A0A1X4JKE4_9LACO|nr:MULTISPECIES: 16S rRNA (uracil(1498)-N(3))-methyltransferase [Weissella]APS27157.1 Ribosomal RNA small subunit methyltransferase E [Weissella cibaria]APU62554.1 Ribosomal RNA small subunit methyltransferase E [Weissella cibaria]APU64706.1 Ribosomal RNA small subunit methyltransferase E [Weissella cibaria]ASS51916.1 Ribosomal RNA small subunit methyltransferase E [Weissella cibaria]AVO67512.1 16S rRNA (uracil(1498)-N(3))-methyltransferase [Weissella cibaria]